jgi:hypothetical protein
MGVFCIFSLFQAQENDYVKMLPLYQAAPFSRSTIKNQL